MQRFIHRENLRPLRERLTRTTAEVECKRIVAMIEEEETKGRVPDGREHTS